MKQVKRKTEHSFKYHYSSDTRIAAHRNAIEEGVNSGEAIDFNPATHLKSLKASKRNA